MDNEFKLPWHEMDNVLDGLNCHEIIVTAVCNERDPANPDTVEKIFRDLLYARTRDARDMFKEYKKQIIKEIKSRTREGK